jgi:hypothetical protein
MFFTRVGLEQATDEWVGAYKATRFAGRHAVADLCCGIGGDLLALARNGPVVGVDCNPIAAHFAAINANTDVRAADVLEFDLDAIDAWHIDPDRRPTGRRTTSLAACQPNLATMERLLARLPHAAIKLAPACAVPAAWTRRCELEWISRMRQCRQLVAWHGDLAKTPGLRRATILAADSHTTPRCVLGAAKQPIPVTDRPDRFVFDVDAAVLAAGLQGVLAAEYSLHALGNGPTYLTGPRAICDPALACFEVADVLPLERRRLARYLRVRSVGTLEIKKRGVDVDPENLRRALKLRGNNSATLLLSRVAGRPTAIVAQRVP